MDEFKQLGRILSIFVMPALLSRERLMQELMVEQERCVEVEGSCQMGAF